MIKPEPGNKYIVGWIKLRGGTEEEFDNLVKPYIETCRAEPECRFFEMMRTREDPGTVFLSECFLSEAAHEVHLGKSHVHEFFNALTRIALVGDFENVIAGSVNPDRHVFDADSAA